LRTLERRHLIQRLPHPTDRRKTLIHLTDEAQRLVDQQLPNVHAVITEAVSDLTEREHARLLTVLTTIRRRLDEQSRQPTPIPKGPRQRVHRVDSE
jgi:DNA-binding MarR family transcriptional regulator